MGRYEGHCTDLQLAITPTSEDGVKRRSKSSARPTAWGEERQQLGVERRSKSFARPIAWGEEEKQELGTADSLG